MKNYFVFIIFILVIFSCSKKVTQAVEENLIIELNTGAVIISSGNSQPFKITVKSKLPKNGIKIDISAVEEATNTPVVPQSSTISSSASITDCLVQNLPRQKWVITTVKVTSASTANNSISQTFKVVYK